LFWNIWGGAGAGVEWVLRWSVREVLEGGAEGQMRGFRGEKERGVTDDEMRI